NRSAFALDPKDQARPNGFTIEQHGAGTAYAVFTPEVGSCQTALFSQDVGKSLARLGLDVVAIAVGVDRVPNPHDVGSPAVSSGNPSFSARCTSARTRSRRSSDDACTSDGGSTARAACWAAAANRASLGASA